MDRRAKARDRLGTRCASHRFDAAGVGPIGAVAGR
jgi:hypothetical protein